jgi:hypothetical protein
MVDVFQNLQCLSDNRMAFGAFDVGDKAHAAGVMFVACIIKALGCRKSHR